MIRSYAVEMQLWLIKWQNPLASLNIVENNTKKKNHQKQKHQMIVESILYCKKLTDHYAKWELRTDICLLCLSIQCISCPLIWATASYQRVSAESPQDGGQWFLPPSASGANILESMLHNACWSSLFLLWGARIRGFAFATKEAEAFNAPSVLT